MNQREQIVKAGTILVIGGVKYFFDEISAKALEKVRILAEKGTTLTAKIHLSTCEGTGGGLFSFSQIEEALNQRGIVAEPGQSLGTTVCAA